MKGITLVISMCLHLGIAFSNLLHQPCQNVKEGVCGRGQRVVYNLDQHICEICPSGTFIDYESHVCELCKNHTKPNLAEVIDRKGDASSDNSIVCRPGFYRRNDFNDEVQGKCARCTICKDDKLEARACTPTSDTVCCLPGKVAARVGNQLTCVSLPPRNAVRSAGRRERSSDGEDENSKDETKSLISADETISNNESGSEINLQEQPAEKESRHSYSWADGGERKMVEFPTWATFLVAGIAVGIFLFYLGVGIPCNACGSLDMLRDLKKVVFRSRNRESADDESRKPINPHPEPSNV